MEVTVNISRLPTTQGTETSQTDDWGRLVILDAKGEFEAECPLVKRSTLIGRDENLDVFVNKMEVSRRHLEVSVQEDDKVYVNSLGRQTVSVNGEPVLKGQPAELFSGDVIEIYLQDRLKCIRYEGNDNTVQLNSSMTIVPTTTALDALLEKTNINPTSLLSTGKKRLTGRKAGAPASRRKSSVKASAVASKEVQKAAPPPPPPLPQGSLLSKKGAKEAASAPLAPPPSLTSLHAAIKSTALKRSQEQALASQPLNPSTAPAMGPKTAASSSVPLIPSITDLQAARAGLRKTKQPQSAEEAALEESDIPDGAAAGNSKRKSVRFALPKATGAAPASPKEGLVSDATCQLPAQVLQPLEEQICIGADSTLAFSAWAMGSAANPTEFIPGLEVLAEGYEPTEEVPAEAVLQIAETGTLPEVTGGLQSAATQLDRAQDAVMTPADDIDDTMACPEEGDGSPGQDETAGEPEGGSEHRTGVQPGSPEELTFGGGPLQEDAPSLADLHQRHAKAWKVARQYFTKNQILVSRMDTMGSKVWALRKENRCLRAENQTLRIALDKAVTEAAHAEAGPQTAGTTPQPQLTRLARRAGTPGSTKAVIRGRPMAGMPDKAEQPGAEEQPAGNACGAEQSPEKQCKAVRKGSAESASGGKSAVGRSFLTPFTAPHRAQPGIGDSVVRDNVMGTIAAAKKMSRNSFGSAMRPSRRQLQGRSPHTVPATITPATTPTVSLLFGSATRAASEATGSPPLTEAAGGEPQPSSAAGTNAVERAHEVDPVGSMPAGSAFDTAEEPGGLCPEAETMEEEFLDPEVEDVTLELPAAGAGREDVEADSTVAFSEWAMGSQAVAAQATIQDVKLIKDQCAPLVVQAACLGPLLLEGPPQKTPEEGPEQAGRYCTEAHKEAGSAAEEANKAAAGEQSGNGEPSEAPGSAGDAVARELRIPKPSSNEHGRTAASPKPVSTGGLGRCRRVTAPSPEEAAAKQPVLGGPLEPILEEAEEKSLEAEDEIPVLSSPAAAEPAAGGEPQQSAEAVRESDEEGANELEAATPEDDACFVCGSCEEDDTLIICEKCERAAHPACVGLKRIPKGDWFCADCKPASKAKGKKATAKSDGPGSRAAGQSRQAVSTRSSEPEAPQSRKRSGARKASQDDGSQPRASKRAKASPQNSSRQPSPPTRSTRGKAAAQKPAEPEVEKRSRLRQ